MTVQSRTVNDTTIRWGYQDGHIEVDVTLPFPVNVVKPFVTLEIEAKYVPDIEMVFREAEQWLSRIRGGRS